MKIIFKLFRQYWHKIQKNILSYIHEVPRWLLQYEPRMVPDKPGTLAHHMDRYGFRILCFALMLLLLQQFGLRLLVAFFGAIVLTLGLHFGLKMGKPRMILRRARVQKAIQENNSDSSLDSQLISSGPKRIKRRYFSQVLTGVGLIGLGWLWDGGWGLYFISIGLINLCLAGVLVLGEKRIKLEVNQKIEN